MKMLVILFLLISGAALYSYTPPDSCLKLVWPDNRDDLNDTGTANPDSVKVDSCIGSPTFGRWFAKRYFRCRFNTYIFDSVIQKNEIKTVYDISTLYPTVKSQFLHLDSIYGSIFFIRNFEDNNWPDSTYFLNGWIDLFFENYQDIDSIVNLFQSYIDSLKIFNYANRAVDPLSVDEKITSEINLTPNPAFDYIEISYPPSEKRGLGGVSVAIFDILGVEITTPSNLTPGPSPGGEGVRIDVSGLPPGVYFVRVGDVVRKFVKW